MLKLFEVTGFKNFENTIRLDFSDVRDYKFNDYCVTSDLLSKIIVYGKNSVGKSNLGLAFFDIVSHLTTNNVTPGLYDYYLNVKNKAGYAEFHYVFTFDSGEVDYRYRKNNKQTLVYESVAIDGKRLFTYDYEDNRGDLTGLEALTTTLNLSFRGTDSILKYAIANSALPNDHPLYRMQRFVSHMLWFRSLDETRYIGYKADSKNYYDFIFQGDMLKELESFLHKAGIKENLVAKKDADGTKRLYFDTRKPLPFFRVASSGTRALYTFFYWNKTAIQLRDEIAEHNNVTWVRAFRFIFNLWESHVSGSFIDVIKALKLYIDIDVRKLTPKVIFQIKKLSDNVFNDVTDQSLTTQVIEKFNAEIKKTEFTDLYNALFKPDFTIPIFEDLDSDRLRAAVDALTWDTSFKLFNEVFSDNSVYMTVHQAKGLEWKKVIVSVTPNNFDKIKFPSLFSNPQLINENPAEEFTRMYYVACSRAEEDLYIHISTDISSDIIETAIKSFAQKNGQKIDYEIIT